MSGSLHVEGIDQVCRAIRKAGREAARTAMKELQLGAMDIIADAKDNLRRGHNNTTGLLRAAGKVQKSGPCTMDVGFFDTTNRSRGYAEYLEFGRRAGRMPPPDEIEAWLKKKSSNKNKSLSALHAASVFTRKSVEQLTRQAAWAIARSIAKSGTKPHPFLGPAVKANMRKILFRVQNALR